jgi:hypothetical protein
MGHVESLISIPYIVDGSHNLMFSYAVYPDILRKEHRLRVFENSTEENVWPEVG